jgi:multidrug transporter EmrE-like cation transporter
LQNFLLILVCVTLGVGGQLMLKHGMSARGNPVDQMVEVVPHLIAAASNPFVIAGGVLYALSFALWLIVLTRADLSYAYPLLSMGYVIVVLLSRVLFQEAVTPIRLAGTLVICVGVFLISRTP